ncbi:DUF6332 family protein [Streptomyces sp. NPDC004610]|uniref:DUF6332 family protein n=1 Tax=unclassified Streptomyces TaxID=2593676 RepID=UPI0033BDBDA0
MSGHGDGHHSLSDRDAITVEIGYALVSAVFVAALLFGAVAGPTLLFDLPGPLERLLRLTGTVLAPVVFLVRVASVLYGFRRSRGGPAS